MEWSGPWAAVIMGRAHEYLTDDTGLLVMVARREVLWYWGPRGEGIHESQEHRGETKEWARLSQMERLEVPSRWGKHPLAWW